MKMIWQGPDGSNPVAGNLKKGDPVETDALPSDIVNEWKTKKWLMVVPAKAQPPKKEVTE